MWPDRAMQRVAIADSNDRLSRALHTAAQRAEIGVASQR